MLRTTVCGVVGALSQGRLTTLCELVSCAGDPSAEAGEGIEDLFGRLGPDERLRSSFQSLTQARMSASRACLASQALIAGVLWVP